MKIEIDGVEYLPAVDLSKLQQYSIHFDDDGYTGGVVPASSGVLVKVKDLESVVPVKPCDCDLRNRDYWKTKYEKERGKVQELKESLALQTDNCKLLEAELDARDESQDALEDELATLREQQTKRPEHLSNRVYASTGVSEGSTGNITVGVTAHCQCGNTFCDDIESAAAEFLKRQGKWELGKPLTLDAWNDLEDTVRVVVVDEDGLLVQGLAHDFVWTANKVYLDPRPLPTPPEPVPEVPRFKGVVRRRSRRSEFIFINEVGLSAVYGITPIGTKDGANIRDVELYNHPEVPNTPELIAALEKN